MASTMPRVRFVMCPKCHKLLTEIAEVPVYKCGGCGVLLRAKHYVANGEEGNSSGSLGINAKSISESSSLNRELTTSLVTEPPIPSSLEGDGGVERVTNSDIHVSVSSTADNNNSEGKEELLDQSSEKSIELEIKPEERIQVEQGHSQDEKLEKFADSNPQNPDSSCSSGKIEQSSVPTGMNLGIQAEDMKLASGSSHSYDGSASSPDRSREDRVPSKYLLKSRRTFRHKKVVMDSVDGTEKEAQQVEGQKIPENRDELPCKPHICAMERDPTFGSEDFHSVQNWVGSEPDEGASKSLPKDEEQLKFLNSKPTTELEPDHMKILRKVDELRDELTGFLAKSVEGKGASHFRPYHFSRNTFSTQSPCSCLAHPQMPMYNKANLPSILEVQTEESGLNKLQKRKEKMVAVKSYCRPVTGGAPFVICYKCWELLQLPADFLVTRKRLHKLQCGACSEVLVFSFRPKTHGAAPMTPFEERHPPSEVENNNVNSYSDAQSYSSGSEPVLNVSRNSSTYAREGRLHRLMGYSSARELLFQPPGVDEEGYQSTAPSTPQFYRPSQDDMRYRWHGTGTGTPYSIEIEEEEEEEEEAPHERLRTRKRASAALQGLLKKGVRELSHGLESMKLKKHSNE